MSNHKTSSSEDFLTEYVERMRKREEKWADRQMEIARKTFEETKKTKLNSGSFSSLQSPTALEVLQARRQAEASIRLGLAVVGGALLLASLLIPKEDEEE